MKNISKSKKGQLNALPFVIITLILAGIFLVLGIVILQELRETKIVNDGNNDTAFVGANQTLVGIGTFADFFTIIVLAVVITVVIGLLLSLFGGKRVR